jgi:hypothetical protein
LNQEIIWTWIIAAAYVVWNYKEMSDLWLLLMAVAIF